VKIEQSRSRFDIPLATRREVEKRLVPLLAEMFRDVLPPPQRREAIRILVPLLLDEGARVAQDWLRRHQLGENFLGWVDPSKAPEAE
jgi:hypothetical protein